MIHPLVDYVIQYITHILNLAVQDILSSFINGFNNENPSQTPGKVYYL